MVLSNAERQAAYRKRLKEAASSTYEFELMQKQIEQLTKAVNEVRAHVGLSEIQLPKSAYKPKAGV
ncbi:MULTISPECIES: hypothetical protein [Sphingobium]|uniref:Mobile element protein n=1 Tax=Sphingobium fuliginis (strain ATCC 27551) TaxID=336203 RepID=A0ABQ1EWV6_SPHSA|nr:MULTISPECIES: hypothetical protein [Sphingobium]RYL98675.1 hypothetical protein EWH10_09190 [Sphingobium fuliginis]WDA37481.1 hypothetical protein PO876_04595 [Sphingobium sp. YC-XJ3]GFZ89593.1 hypothetical protein GCM10019071_19450 [Sphingobium fuliginis]